jgi:hypothetical protein
LQRTKSIAAHARVVSEQRDARDHLAAHKPKIIGSTHTPRYQMHSGGEDYGAGKLKDRAGYSSVAERFLTLRPRRCQKFVC